MHKNQSTNEPATKPSIEAFALPSELRRTHNFASRARPIIGLDLPLNRATAGGAKFAQSGVSHAPSRRTPSMPETDFLIESRLGDNDPSYGLPASWREPQQQGAKKRRRWSWSERSTAAFSGFAGGLIVVLPLIFILGGHTAITPPLSETARTTDFSFASTAAYVEAFWKKGADEKTAPPVTSNTRDAAGAGPLPLADIEAKAVQALGAGQIDEARRTLRTAASPENPRLWLLLAQTYDPGDSGAADPATASNDVEFARFYYRQALAYGIEAARPRLDALSSR